MTFLNGANYQLDILKGSPTVENVEFLGTVKNNSLIIRNGHPVIKKSRFKAKSRKASMPAPRRSAPRNGLPVLRSRRNRNSLPGGRFGPYREVHVQGQQGRHRNFRHRDGPSDEGFGRAGPGQHLSGQ